MTDGLKRIGNCAFWGCIHLKELVVPDTVESIGYNAWDHCEELATITIGKNVTKIGDETICNCESLQTIIFKNPVSWKAAKEEIDSADLADPFKAVEMMRKYVYCEWERKK